MKNKQRALLISVFVLSTLFLLNLTISFSTIYDTGWINTYIRDLAERSEYSVEEMPWFTRIDHISDSSLPYGTDDASGSGGNCGKYHRDRKGIPGRTTQIT